MQVQTYGQTIQELLNEAKSLDSSDSDADEKKRWLRTVEEALKRTLGPDSPLLAEFQRSVSLEEPSKKDVQTGSKILSRAVQVLRMTSDELEADRLWRQIQLVMNDRFKTSIWFQIPAVLFVFVLLFSILGYIDIRGVKVDVRGDGLEVRKNADESARLLQQAEGKVADLDVSVETVFAEANSKVAGLNTRVETAISDAEGKVAGLNREVETAISKAELNADQAIVAKLFSLNSKLDSYSAELPELEVSLMKTKESATRLQGQVAQLQSMSITEIPTLKKAIEDHIRSHETTGVTSSVFLAAAVGFAVCLIVIAVLSFAKAKNLI